MALRPAFPFMEYIFDYEYISTVLCENKEIPEMNCNGKCYLMKALAEASQKESGEKKKSHTASIELLPFVFTETGFDIPKEYIETTKIEFPIVSEFTGRQNFQTLFRPPIV